jgi:hypothetical protein
LFGLPDHPQAASLGRLFGGKDDIGVILRVGRTCDLGDRSDLFGTLTGLTHDTRIFENRTLGDLVGLDPFGHEGDRIIRILAEHHQRGTSILSRDFHTHRGDEVDLRDVDRVVSPVVQNHHPEEILERIETVLEVWRDHVELTIRTRCPRQVDVFATEVALVERVALAIGRRNDHLNRHITRAQRFGQDRNGHEDVCRKGDELLVATSQVTRLQDFLRIGDEGGVIDAAGHLHHALQTHSHFDLISVVPLGLDDEGRGVLQVRQTLDGHQLDAEGLHEAALVLVGQILDLGRRAFAGTRVLDQRVVVDLEEHEVVQLHVIQKHEQGREESVDRAVFRLLLPDFPAATRSRDLYRKLDFTLVRHGTSFGFVCQIYIKKERFRTFHINTYTKICQ